MCYCGHSFCNSCLVSHAGRAASWACPKCREVTNSTVEALPRNFDLENFVETLDNVEIRPKANAEFGYCDRHQAAIKLRKHISYPIRKYFEVHCLLRNILCNIQNVSLTVTKCVLSVVIIIYAAELPEQTVKQWILENFKSKSR